MVSSIDEPLAVGFDIGGSNTKIGLVSKSGQIFHSKSIPTDVQTVGVTLFIQTLIEEIRAMINVSPVQVKGIGGTFLGWINEEHTSPFLCLNAPLLHGVDIKNLLRSTFSLPVWLIDDTNAHALAEYLYGSGKGESRFMCLALGTGVSAGMIINGKPLNFTGGCIGDTGHLILRPNGPRCSAGCSGCAEALIGVEGIERLAFEKTGSRLSARRIIELARDIKDPVAIQVIEEIGGYVGELLASLSHIFLPELIAISGGTANAGDLLLKAAQQRFEEINGDYHRTYAGMAGDYYKGVNLVLGKLKSETGMIGATAGLFFPEYQNI